MILRRLFSSASTRSSPAHIPVLASKALEFLLPTDNKIYIDMTFGAGGHTKQLLDSLPSLKIFALDRDPVAYEKANQMQESYPDRLIPLLGKFSDLPILLKQQNISFNSIDGILFDFGCSSMQFDEAERGFSLSKNGPLDMRMDKGANSTQITAAELLSKIDEHDLVKILRVYGEEKAAKKIARGIVEARQALHKIETTHQLANLIASCLSDSTHERKDKLNRPAHVATKTFQALRIFINNELNEINYGMILAQKFLKKEGRLVTITFHSLEDTIVKRHIHGNVIEGRANPVPLKYSSHDLIHNMDLIEGITDCHWKQLHKHVIVPDDEEVSKNSRSRSAKLRAAIKIK